MKKSEKTVGAKKLIPLLGLMAALLFTGCGEASSTGTSADEAVVQETMAAAPALPEAESVMESAASEGSGQAGDGESLDVGSASLDTDAPLSRKLIRNVSLDAEAREYDHLLSRIQEEAGALGGYIEYMDSYAPGGRQTGTRNATITARIPSDRMSEFMDNALAGAKITRKSENVQDVTLDYTDTEAREKALRIEQDRLMELLAQANSTESLIALEKRLSEIRYEIESLNSQLRVYDNQVQYSTVSMYITEVQTLTAVEEDGFGAQLQAGFSRNLDRLTGILRNGALFFLTGLPLLLPIAIILVLGYSILKWRRKRMAQKYADFAAKNPEGPDRRHGEDKTGKTESHS